MLFYSITNTFCYNLCNTFWKAPGIILVGDNSSSVTKLAIPFAAAICMSIVILLARASSAPRNKPKKAQLTIDYDGNYLISSYQLFDETISNQTILGILSNEYFSHLLSDTDSIFTKETNHDQLKFSITTPYKRG